LNGFLTQLWDRVAGRKYITIGTLGFTMNWSDTGEKSYVTVMLQENSEGKRRLKSESSSRRLKASEFDSYHKYCLPWEQGLIEAFDIPRLVTSPHAYKEIDYAFIGTVSINGEFKDSPYNLDYYLFQNINGKRRVAMICEENNGIYSPVAQEHCGRWIRQEIGAAEIPSFIPAAHSGLALMDKLSKKSKASGTLAYSDFPLSRN